MWEIRRPYFGMIADVPRISSLLPGALRQETTRLVTKLQELSRTNELDQSEASARLAEKADMLKDTTEQLTAASEAVEEGKQTVAALESEVRRQALRLAIFFLCLEFGVACCTTMVFRRCFGEPLIWCIACYHV